MPCGRDEGGHVLQLRVDEERRPVDDNTNNERTDEGSECRAEATKCDGRKHQQQDAGAEVPLHGVKAEEGTRKCGECPTVDPHLRDDAFNVDTRRLGEIFVVADCPHGATGSSSGEPETNSNEDDNRHHHCRRVATGEFHTQKLVGALGCVILIDAITTAEKVNEHIPKQNRKTDRHHHLCKKRYAGIACRAKHHAIEHITQHTAHHRGEQRGEDEVDSPTERRR
jgi:hypothetical protein